MDSAQKIGHWKVVDSRHWTLDSIENEQKIGQSPADSNWTVKFLSTLCALFLMKNFVYCSVRTTVGCPLYTVHYLLFTIYCSLSTVHCPLSTVQFFLSKNLLQLIFRGQWTVDKNCKIVSRSGGVLCNPVPFITLKNNNYFKKKTFVNSEITFQEIKHVDLPDEESFNFKLRYYIRKRLNQKIYGDNLFTTIDSGIKVLTL